MQYYRKARQMALHSVFPEIFEDDGNAGVGRLSYPRPISEPPSPSSSRATTPIPSDHSDADDEVDEEQEVNSLSLSPNKAVNALYFQLRELNELSIKDGH